MLGSARDAKEPVPCTACFHSIIAQRLLSPSPSLGVTTAVMGNCGFGIVPSPPAVRDLILRNLSVVEGMDLDALREGVQWDFESFPDYMAALRAASPYLNIAVLAGHSVIRTAVMGEAASEQKNPSTEQLARMQAMVAEAMANGAVGLGGSYSLNHSGYGGVPMPSTISDLGEFEALVAAMGDSGHGVVQVASGARSVEGGASAAAVGGVVGIVGGPVGMAAGAAFGAMLGGWVGKKWGKREIEDIDAGLSRLERL